MLPALGRDTDLELLADYDSRGGQRWAKQDLQTTVRALRRTPADIQRERGTTNGAAWVELALRPHDPLIGTLRHAGHRGKGAAIRTALAQLTTPLILI